MKIIRMPELMDKVGLSKATIYRLIAEGIFPKPVKLGHRSVGWLEGVIDDFLEERQQI